MVLDIRGDILNAPVMVGQQAKIHGYGYAVVVGVHRVEEDGVIVLLGNTVAPLPLDLCLHAKIKHTEVFLPASWLLWRPWHKYVLLCICYIMGTKSFLNNL